MLVGVAAVLVLAAAVLLAVLISRRKYKAKLQGAGAGGSEAAPAGVGYDLEGQDAMELAARGRRDSQLKMLPDGADSSG